MRLRVWDYPHKLLQGAAELRHRLRQRVDLAELDVEECATELLPLLHQIPIHGRPFHIRVCAGVITTPGKFGPKPSGWSGGVRHAPRSACAQVAKHAPQTALQTPLGGGEGGSLASRTAGIAPSQETTSVPKFSLLGSQAEREGVHRPTPYTLDPEACRPPYSSCTGTV